MLSKMVLFLIALAFHALVLPRFISKLCSMIGIRSGTNTLQNMNSSLFQVTKERSTLHTVEKFVVAMQTLLFYNMLVNFNAFYIIVLALLLCVEFMLLVSNKKATSFCWAGSWYVKALRSDDRGKQNTSNASRGGVRDNLRKQGKLPSISREDKVYEKNRSRQQAYAESLREQATSGYTTVNEKDENLLKMRDVKKSVSAMTTMLQEMMVLRNSKNMTNDVVLKGPAIFTNDTDINLLDVRLDNAINNGAVGLLWQYVCPALMMDLNLMRIVKTDEIELFDNIIQWTNKPLKEIENDMDAIENQVMTLGIKLVKLTLWFKNTCGHINCMKLEFASSIIHKDYLVAKLHRLVEDLDIKAGIVDYRDTNAFFYSLTWEQVEKEALDTMIAKQKFRDLICYTARSKYQFPQILLQATVLHSGFENGDVSKPEHADTITNQIDFGNTAQLMRLMNTSNKSATCYTYLIDTHKAKDIYKRAVGCASFNFQQFYRVTTLREVLGVIINTNPSIKKNGSFAIAIGDDTGSDTWHIVSFANDRMKEFLEDSDNAFFANLYFTARRDLFEVYNKVEYMYILWDLTELQKAPATSTFVQQHSDLCKEVIRVDKLSKSKATGIFASDAPDTIVYTYQAEYDIESAAWLDNLINDNPSIEVAHYDFSATKLRKELTDSYKVWSKGSKLFNVFVTVDKSLKQMHVYGVSVIKITNSEGFDSDLEELLEETVFKNKDNSKCFRVKLNY